MSTTMNEVPAKILERAKALMAMRDHAGSNPQESALAAEHLEKLMIRWTLTEAFVRGKSQDAAIAFVRRDYDIPGADTPQKWRNLLIKVIGDCNFCDFVIITSGRKFSNKGYVVGRDENIDACLWMIDYLINEVIRLGKVAWTTKRHGTESKATFLSAFYLGAFEQLKHRLRTAYADSLADIESGIIADPSIPLLDEVGEESFEPIPDSRALAINIRDQLAEATKKLASGKLTPGKTITYKVPSQGGYRTGFNEAKNIPLTKVIDGGTVNI